MGPPKRDYRNLRYKCQYCFYATNRPSHLKRHYLTHTQERPFSCTVCGKSFNQKVSLQEHLRIHTGEKPFQCEYCKVRFTQRSSLKNHRRLHLKDDGAAANNALTLEMGQVQAVQDLNYTVK